jgi:ABC-type transporter Mla MlaB component
MLRIRVEEKPKATTLYVEGKLAGASVDELCRVWTSKRNEAPEKEMVVDLCSVRSVDSAGRKLLTQMHGWGTHLSGNGLCISPLIEEITSAGSYSASE